MKIAVSTTCSDGYSIFLDHLIKSILKHNPGFDKDFFIFCDARLCQKNRDHFKSLYNGFIFKDVDNTVYEQNHKGSIKYYSIEAFGLTDYDRVIYWGADMLCMRSLDELWIEAEGEFEVAMTKEWRRGDDLPYNNGGMIIGKQHLTGDTYRKLIGHNVHDKPGHLTDQKLYNYFFAGRITKIERKYNTLVSELEFSLWRDIIMLHYIFKPTTPNGRSRLKKECLDAWREYDNPKGLFADVIS